MKSLFISAVQSTMVFFGILVACDAAYGQAPISLSVDLRDAPRKLLHATEIIPVRPGAMTLAYPKWIGNEHELGPIGQQAGVFIAADRDGRPIAMRMRWERDPIDLYLYHIKALTTVAPNDWAAFFAQRLHELTPTAPLGGITGSGYRVVKEKE